ncbi:MAG: hypothetical protein V4615_06040 [Bacteroidota bacterium]
MYYCEQDSAGFMTIDVNGLQLDAKYFDSWGNLKDNFTIIKSNQNPNGAKSLKDEISELNIYSNPFTTHLQIDLNMVSSQNLDIDLIDIQEHPVSNCFSFHTFKIIQHFMPHFFGGHCRHYHKGA